MQVLEIGSVSLFVLETITRARIVEGYGYNMRGDLMFTT